MTSQEFIDSLASKLDNCPVLKSLAIAQACLESGFGKKSFYNNIYGIKCHDPDKYAGCRLGRTSEVIDGSYRHNLRLAFQTYDSIDDSIADYCRLMNLSRYKRVREADNYIDATQAIKDCGYATSLTYVNSLRRVISNYKLTKYDGGGKVDYNTKLTENFFYGEFWSNSLTGRKVEPPIEYFADIEAGARQLQKIRNAIGRPIRVSSAYRTNAWNTAVGGSSRSKHLEAKAFDIQCAIPLDQLIFYAGKHSIFKGVGISYKGRFLHLDFRNSTTFWYY